MSAKSSPEVVVIGAGVTGLLLARALTRFNVSVMILESEPRIFTGATSHNEGWLHHGTYHAISIADEAIAKSVAQRCIYGAQRIKAIAPEALEEPLRPSYAFTTRGNVSEVENRWRASEVQFERISADEARTAIPQLRLEDITAVYRVADRAIDTRMLCAVLSNELRRANVPLLTKAAVTRLDGTSLKVELPDDAFRVEPKLVILATGFSTRYVTSVLGLPSPPIRLWRSHLLVTPRLTPHAIFSVDPDQPALMHHGPSTVVGLNEDAEVVAEPGYSIDQTSVDHLFLRLGQRIDTGLPMASVLPVACTKVDLELAKNKSRSLAPAAAKLADGYYTLLPGKMTEAPYVVDQALVQLLNDIDFEWAVDRPCDTIPKSNDELTLWKDEIWTS